MQKFVADEASESGSECSFAGDESEGNLSIDGIVDDAGGDRGSNEEMHRWIAAERSESNVAMRKEVEREVQRIQQAQNYTMQSSQQYPPTLIHTQVTS